MMRQKLLVFLLLGLSIFGACTSGHRLGVRYLDRGRLRTETIPTDFIDARGGIVSPHIRSVKFSRLDSVDFPGNNPDRMKIHSTAIELDFTRPIARYSPEYYTAYTVHHVEKAIAYYNGLFEGRIDFNALEDYRDLEVMFGDVPLFSSPKTFIFEAGSNPSPSLFFHEVGHRAFWYLEGEWPKVRFGGLSYIHMGLLEYFTVSLNDSPVVGEDFLPVKTIRNASWLYPYPAPDSLRLGTTMSLLAESYPEAMRDPQSIVYRYWRATTETYKDFLDRAVDNHRGGMIVTSTLWRIREQLGRALTDRLVAQAILTLCIYYYALPRVCFCITRLSKIKDF